MMKCKNVLTFTAAIVALAGCQGGSSAPSAKGDTTPAKSGDKVKIAFIVKQPEEQWFQLEWKFADEAAAKDGFELIRLPAPDGDVLRSKIDTAASQGAKGVVICSPDVRLGSSIVAQCKQRNLKLMSVDDQLVGPDNKPLTDVPHLGISARKIGNNVGEGLMAEMKKRGWKPEETGLMVITRDELDTAKERTEGAIEGATKAGFDSKKIFKAPQKTTDVPGGRDAGTVVLTQHPEVKNWLIAGMNDAAVIGAVRATESRNIPAAQVIGIGINGDSSLDELKSSKPTGLYGSILLQAKRHGFETADMMYKWIAENKEPAKITYTDGILLTRDNLAEELKKQGLAK